MTIVGRAEGASCGKTSDFVRYLIFAVAAVAVFAVFIGVMSADDSSANPTVVTLVIEGGEGTDGAGTVEVDAKRLTVTSAPALSGYMVEGYYIDPELQHKIAQNNGILYGNINYDDKDWTNNSGQWVNTDSPVTIYAKWKLGWYTAYFYNRYVMVDNFTAAYGSDITARVAEIQPTEEGFIFSGWDPAVPDTMPADGFTTYAVWDPISYTIRFHANGGTGTMDDVPMEYGEDILLPYCTFTREGCFFSGWLDAPDGDIIAADHQSEANMTAVNGGIVDLYAHWDKYSYTIIFNKNDGGDSMVQQEGVESGVATKLMKNTFTRDGYVFRGWNTEFELDGEEYADEAYITHSVYSFAQHISLYAMWEPIIYNITFDPNEGDGDMSAITSVKYGESKVVENAFERTGYTFSGEWAVGDPSGTHVSSPVSNLTTTNGATVTLYALWTPITYIIAFNGNGETSGSMSNLTEVSYGTDQALPAFGFVKTGYTFKGEWAIGSADSSIRVTDSVNSLTTVQDDIITLYALWAPKNYTITLVAGEGGNNDGTATVTYNSNNFHVTTLPTKNGFEVMQYLATDSGGAVANADGTLFNYAGWVSGGKWCRDGEDLRLYVSWYGKEYDVQFRLNGGNGDDYTVKIRYTMDTKSISSGIPERDGYIFMGYYDAPENGLQVFNQQGRPIQYVSGWTTNGWGNYSDQQVLYAHWMSEPYDLTIYDGDFAMGCVLEIRYDANDASLKTGSLEVTGYNLEGLYAESTYQTKVLDGSLSTLAGVQGWTDANGKWKHIGDTGLYAKYVPKTTALTLDKNGGISDGSATATYDSNKLTNITAVTRTGYTLNGYFSDATDGVKVANADGSLCADTTWTDSEGNWKSTKVSLTLYAQWTVNTYTVTIDASGGTGSYQQQVTYGTTNDVPDITSYFSMTGHHISWAIRDSYGTEVISHEVYVATGENHYYFVRHNQYIDDDMNWVYTDDLTLYIDWDANTYTGILSTGGLGTDGSFEITYGFNTLNVTHATRVGYDNAGYFTEPNGGGTYALTGNLESTYYIAHNLPGLTDADGKWIYAGTEPATLYATWTAQIFHVDIDKNGGDTDGLYQAQYMSDHMTIQQQAARTGYSLAGIYTDAECTAANQIADKDGKFLEKSITDLLQDGHWIGLNAENKFYAKWEANKYTITFNTDGGSAIDPIEVSYEAYVPAPANPTKEGYKFISWSPVLPAKMPTQNMTVKAVWVLKPEITNGDAVIFNDSTSDEIVIDMSLIAEPLADASKKEISVSGDGWKMEIPKEILSGVTGNVSVGAKTLSAGDIDAMPTEVKTILSGKTVYSLSLTDSNGAISFNGSSITVSLPYTLKEGENASDVKVFFINAENKAEQVDARYDADTKCAVFTTTHFSTWYVDATADGSGSNGGFPIWIIFMIVAVVAAAGAGAFFVMKKKA